MTEPLKTCPFCGRPAHRITPMGFWEAGKGYGPSGVRYVCSSLYVEPIKICPGSETFYGENAEAEASAAWNTRTALAELGDKP